MASYQAGSDRDNTRKSSRVSPHHKCHQEQMQIELHLPVARAAPVLLLRNYVLRRDFFLLEKKRKPLLPNQLPPPLSATTALHLRVSSQLTLWLRSPREQSHAIILIAFAC